MVYNTINYVAELIASKYYTNNQYTELSDKQVKRKRTIAR